MNKLLRHALFACLFLAMLLSGAARAQQDGSGVPGGATPVGPDGRGPGGRGRGGFPGGPPPDGAAPNGGANRHGAPPSAAGGPAAASLKVPGKAASSGQQFYIVSSIDPQKQEMLLKRPTEVTLLMKIGDATQITDESGKPMKLLDLRAGDTVWVTSSGGGLEPTAVHIRKGQMTVADLHRFYLDYGEIK
jgi:hypothetical protein